MANKTELPVIQQPRGMCQSRVVFHAILGACLPMDVTQSRKAAKGFGILASLCARQGEDERCFKNHILLLF